MKQVHLHWWFYTKWTYSQSTIRFLFKTLPFVGSFLKIFKKFSSAWFFNLQNCFLFITNTQDENFFTASLKFGKIWSINFMKELSKMPWKPYECLLNVSKWKLLTNGSIPYFLCVSLNGFYTSNLSILNHSQYLLLKQTYSIKHKKLVRKSESYQCKTVYFFLLFTDHKCSVTLVCTKSIVCLRKDYKENAMDALICYGQQC